jgi:hypothetical protein
VRLGQGVPDGSCGRGANTADTRVREARGRKPMRVRLPPAAPFDTCSGGWNWNTPRSQKSGPERACGFESRPEYQPTHGSAGQPGVAACLSSRRSRVQIPSEPPIRNTPGVVDQKEVAGAACRRWGCDSPRLHHTGPWPRSEARDCNPRTPRCDSGRTLHRRSTRHRARTRPGPPKASEAVQPCPVVPQQPHTPPRAAERRRP